MSKKKNTTTSTATTKKSFHGLGRFLKVVGITMLVCWVIYIVAFSIGGAMISRPNADAAYTVTGFDVGANSVHLTKDGEELNVYLMGIILNPDAPADTLEQYVGAQVVLEEDIICGKECNGMPQGYLVMVNTDHILQMDMLVNGDAALGDLPSRAKHHLDFWEASLGAYPER